MGHVWKPAGFIGPDVKRPFPRVLTPTPSSPTVVFAAPAPPSFYFTSLLYPLLVEESLEVAVPGAERGWLFPFTDSMNVGVPSIVSGALTLTLVLLSYTNERDVNPDQLSVGVPAINAGTLNATIAYVTYTNQRDVAPDSMSVGVPSIQSGSLAVTELYVTYTNQRDVAPDNLTAGVPAITSGTLA